jgi:hypothetical protein
MFANNSLVKVNLLASVDKGPPHCRLSVPDEPVGGLLQCLVVDGLHQAAHQLVYVEAGGCLHVAALVVILGGGFDLVGGVTDPVLFCEAPLGGGLSGLNFSSVV